MSLSSGAYLGSHSTVSQCVRAASATRESLLTWIGPLSSTRTTGLTRRPGHGTVELIELLKMRHEISAALGRAGVDDELARNVIERAQDCHFFGLSRRWHAQISA